MKRQSVHIALLFVASLLLFLLRLGAPALWDNSEPTYAEIAREILATGDWLTMRYGGEPFFVHPPLYYWLTAAAIWIFGPAEWVVRLWSALFGACGILATCLLGRILYDHRAGLAGGLILMATLEYMILSRLVLMDTMLNCFTLVSLVGFVLAYHDRSSKGLLLSYVGSALAVLSKGPVGIVLPLLVIVALLGVRRDLRLLATLLNWGGVGLFAVIVLPWYVSQLVIHGKAFVATNLAQYTFGRYLAVVEGQPGPVYYYVPVLLAGFFPWIAFLPWLLRRLWRDRQALASQFLLLGLGIIFVLFSLSRTKQPNYIITFLPRAAIATGRFFTASSPSATTPFWRSPFAQGGMAALVVAGLFMVAGFLYVPSMPAAYSASAVFLLPLGLIWIAGVLLSLLVLRARRNPVQMLVVQAASCLLLFGYVIFGFLPEAERYKYTKPFALYVRDHAGADTVTLGYGFLLPSTFYYSGGTARMVDGPELHALLSRRARFYLVTDEEHFGKLDASELTVIRRISAGVLAAPAYVGRQAR